MIRIVLQVAIAVVVAVLGGAASAWYALKAREGVGAVTIGDWSAYPDIGTPSSDPYSKARVAREGLLALGRAEGIAFVAQRDSNGDMLDRACSYTVEGTLPAARLWTLYPTDESMNGLVNLPGRPPAVSSRNILRLADNSLSIAVSHRPSPGNWLSIEGRGRLLLVLTLYDTPIASSTGISGVELPQVLKTDCDA